MKGEQMKDRVESGGRKAVGQRAMGVNLLEMKCCVFKRENTHLKLLQ